MAGKKQIPRAAEANFRRAQLFGAARGMTVSQEMDAHKGEAAATVESSFGTTLFSEMFRT
jgi:hypothetical protein